MSVFLKLVTGLGDAALLLPAAAALLLYLARARAWRAAAAWIAALALCAILTAAAKMTFHACGAQLPALDIRSPSGHTSLSTAFYGCGALMLSADRSWSRRLGALLGAAILAVAVAASRVALRAHSVDEVAAGFAIGLICVVFFAASYLPWGRGALGWRLPVMLVILLALFTHGHHLGVEGLLHRLADRWQLARHICPVDEDLALRTIGPGPLREP
jgi:membrane-associated phospholipid phosphatase